VDLWEDAGRAPGWTDDISEDERYPLPAAMTMHERAEFEAALVALLTTTR
jgi:hypothetical protein